MQAETARTPLVRDRPPVSSGADEAIKMRNRKIRSALRTTGRVCRHGRRYAARKGTKPASFQEAASALGFLRQFWKDKNYGYDRCK
jgi:hypothetical protein